jgi:hypothetical protein
MAVITPGINRQYPFDIGIGSPNPFALDTLTILSLSATQINIYNSLEQQIFSFTGTFTSGWTFASTGVTPNGTSAYMDTNLIPNTCFGLTLD